LLHLRRTHDPVDQSAINGKQAIQVGPRFQAISLLLWNVMMCTVTSYLPSG